MNYLLSIVILICTLPVFSQQKKDSKVIAEVSDTTNLFKRVAKVLYERGYDLESKDEQLKFISTKDRELKKYAAKVRTRINIQGNTIVFTSKVGLSFKSEFGDMYSDVSFVGAKASPMREAWNEMVELAKQFGNVTYSK